MALDDDDAETTTSDTPALTGRARRRSARPWSNPSAAAAPATDRARDSRWSSPAPPPAPVSRPPTSSPLGAPGADLGAVTDQLKALQTQLSALQTAIAAPAPSASLVTGPELAAAIEQLGTTLGGGMATLLTEHRNLLARDVSAAADRILEEVSTRLRAAATQTVDGVEERIRHLVTRATTELGEQLDLRLDKLQADVTGLRAVMLEIPDQTVVTDRLDQLAETVAGAKGRDSGRVSPAMAAAIERAVSAPLEQLDDSVHSIVGLVRDLLDERLPDEALETLTREVTALKRRISLRSTVSAEEAEPDEAPVDIPVVAEPPADEAEPTTTPTTKVAGRRGRRTIKD